jgi:hypothetical protein
VHIKPVEPVVQPKPIELENVPVLENVKQIVIDDDVIARPSAERRERRNRTERSERTERKSRPIQDAFF